MNQATAVPAAEVTLDKLAKMYIKMRERIQELTRAYETEVEGIKAQQTIVAHEMKDRIRATMGGEISSVRTAHGTIILSTKTRYYAQDWDAFGAFVIAQGNVGLLEKRVAQGNMAEFLKANPGVSPPGLSSMTEVDVSVRKVSAA